MEECEVKEVLNSNSANDRLSVERTVRHLELYSSCANTNQCRL